MDLTNKCSPDILEIEQTITLYEGQKKAFIKSKILSGECDEQLRNIALQYPIIPLLFYTGLNRETIMLEDIDTTIFEIGDGAKELLQEIYNKDFADFFMNNLFTIFDEYVSEVYDKACLKINIKNNDTYCFSFFKYEFQVLDDWNYCDTYYVDMDYDYLKEYWKSILVNIKDDFLEVLSNYMEHDEEDGEEIVDISNL